MTKSQEILAKKSKENSKKSVKDGGRTQKKPKRAKNQNIGNSLPLLNKKAGVLE